MRGTCQRHKTTNCLKRLKTQFNINITGDIKRQNPHKQLVKVTAGEKYRTEMVAFWFAKIIFEQKRSLRTDM